MIQQVARRSKFQSIHVVEGRTQICPQTTDNQCIFFRATATYHSAGATAGSAGSPQTAVTVEEHAPGAMYADPKQIEHEAATTGDQYALITSNTKAKKKNGQVSGGDSKCRT